MRPTFGRACPPHRRPPLLLTGARYAGQVCEAPSTRITCPLMNRPASEARERNGTQLVVALFSCQWKTSCVLLFSYCSSGTFTALYSGGDGREVSTMRSGSGEEVSLRKLVRSSPRGGPAEKPTSGTSADRSFKKEASCGLSGKALRCGKTVISGLCYWGWPWGWEVISGRPRLSKQHSPRSQSVT